ncbi:disease resistance protein at4g27190 [Phtheirospermum japonicum]|uniref:Disease resistance protein at4g27190 n=1 Tax=Phtheirospermum japonicum TaxID=374723 RepID=A0A830D2X5_9LAMI|nr:disease resistance protein at4g27190 [Phtheirospermum japonicum]
MAFKTTSDHQHKYVGKSQTIGKIMDDVFNRLSILLFRIDEKINELLMKGGYPPKKLNQWGMEARDLKYQENYVRERRNKNVDSLEHEELELVKIVTKIVNHLKKCPFKDEMMYDKPVPVIISTHKSDLGKQSKNMEKENEAEVPEYQKAEQSPNPVQAHKIESEPIESDGVMTTVAEIESEPMSESVDITQDTSNPSCEQNMQPRYSHLVPVKKHYSFNLKEGHLELGLDHQPILILDVPLLGSPESARVDDVITLVETDIRELSENPDYINSLFLLIQRNNCLNHIDSSFFNSMPKLCFLDLSDTKIRTLPSSLFNLSTLEVLLLRNCICLDTLPSEIGGLNRLQVLDLLGTDLYNLPKAIGQLIRLRCLQLSFYGPDDESEYSHLPHELIPDGTLSKLVALEALSITVHPEDHRWKEIAAYITKNIGSLGKLSFIQFYFPEIEIFRDFIQTRPSWKDQRLWKFIRRRRTTWEEQGLKKFKFIVGNNVKRVVSRVPGEVESLFDQQDRSLRYVNVDKVPQVIKLYLIVSPHSTWIITLQSKAC